MAARQVDANPPPVRDPGAAAAVFRVRPFCAGDLALVRDSWLRSAWGVEKRRLQEARAPQRVRMLAGAAWYAENRPKVTAMLLEPGGVTVLVACAAEDRDHIGGWLAVHGGVVVYAYTKQAYRGWGLIRLLAESAGVEWGKET